MDTNLILKNLDNGTITQDTALDLMFEHTSLAYAIGMLLDTRKQRNDYREQLNALQDNGARPIMDGNVITDLIDHALATDHISSARATSHLIHAGMDSDVAFHHVETIETIKARDAERANYLDFPENAPRWCTRCGDKVTAKDVSNRGICKRCADYAEGQNRWDLQKKSGPGYTRWRNAMLAWAYTLEDQEIAEKRVSEHATLGDTIDKEKPCPRQGDCWFCPTPNCKDRQASYDGKDDGFPTKGTQLTTS